VALYSNLRLLHARLPVHMTNVGSPTRERRHDENSTVMPSGVREVPAPYLDTASSLIFNSR
jgi:hypothetical protein